jgi:type II secretory ATPase GspE/PulE/Tfp pilus assembly ATPase PilB-like protein
MYMVVFADDEQEKRITFLKRREEEELAQMLSRKYGVEYIDLSLVAINSDALRLIPEAQAREAEAAVFGAVGKRVSIAARAPANPKVVALMQDLTVRGYAPTLFMTSQESLKRAFERYADLSYAKGSQAGVFDLSDNAVEELLDKIKNFEDIKALVEEAIAMKRAYRVTRILEVILAGGLSTNASDIHFEPEETDVHLRYRLDGVLVDALSFDHETYRLALSRLKLLSGMKLNLTAIAQDGRFSIKVKGEEIELRASILPGNYGETLVLRLLNPKSIAVPLDELGIEPKLLARLDREISRPNGMILTTGPTGAGKTTTLYAFLRKVNVSGTKIITIEDPIEYHLPVVQTQVEKNYSFGDALRSALRSDPDIIMVGEIRDADVAETAINAALTGHLVFSTLHTNDAAGSFPRLIDLGVSEKVLSSAINAAMAQRLVRKLCPVCRAQRPASAPEEEMIARHVATIVDRSLIPTASNLHNVYDAKPGGCPECHGRGYKGRVGIFECIFMDGKIEEVLRTKPSGREVALAARPQGIPNMQEDGVLKVLSGVTSLSELARVVDLG